MSKRDENQELQKQMGCISGFFQLFGHRQWFLTGEETSNEIKELSNKRIQKATAKNAKGARENQQSSTESSGTSMSSSSCSSSLSSLEFNRTVQVEAPPSTDQIKISENSNSGHQSVEFYDIVKDSMQREARGLSVRTVAKEEKKSRILRHIDSPRPQKAPWDLPRYSYDGRDVQQTLRCATKHQEIRRLSLDSKEGSLKGFGEAPKPETSKRASSVVAKLMGLEAFPDWTQTYDTPPSISSCSTNRNETFAKASAGDGYSQHQSLVSPTSSSKGSRRDETLFTNAMPYSRFSQEPTPWSKPEASKDSQLQVSKGSECSPKTSSPSLSVYGEIEKRIADLQFKNSGKDLRALKQILEAMQRYKDSADTTRDEASNFPSYGSLIESSQLQSRRIQQKEETSNSTRGRKLPIVIIKPAAQVTRKTSSPASMELPIRGSRTNGRVVDKLDRKTAKGSISQPIGRRKDPFCQPFHSGDKSNKMRTSKLTQSARVSPAIDGENITNWSHIAESRSPRVQKKFGLERCSLTCAQSYSGSNSRQHKQSLEPSSPVITPGQKISTLQQRNKRFSNRSVDSHSDIEGEAIQVYQYEENNSVQLNGLTQDNAEKELSKESFMAKTTVTAEQPSPVSVLDAAFYKEDPPSPVKKKSQISKDLDETSDNDFQTQNLVQILQQNDEKFTSFGETKNPDHKYIAEILVASGLLSSPSSSNAVHSPGHLISPKLFLALEQIKTNKMHFNIEHIARKNNTERLQRKLIFDVVNDILHQKLTLESFSTLRCLPDQAADPKQNGQKLSDELCQEIETLQHRSRNISQADEDEILTSLLWGDLMHRRAVWTERNSEMPNIVLDIERLIFKDLITEVLRGEVANHPGRYCR